MGPKLVLRSFLYLRPLAPGRHRVEAQRATTQISASPKSAERTPALLTARASINCSPLAFDFAVLITSNPPFQD